jgi:CheY-like chemotaxis protein
MSEIKCRILCVDDHEDSSLLLKMLLRESDHEVSIAKTMDEAIQLAKQTDFDLYVMDKHLPDGSGIELCRKLMELTPGVPCIFYSGDAYDVHRQEALAAGANAYVPKPDVDALIEEIEKLLSERQCATAS